jgi:DUF2892 family protein
MVHRNVGGVDRAARVALGLLLLPTGLFLWGEYPGYGLALILVGLIGLITGIFGFCPPYRLFGISTARPPRPTAPRAPGG